MNYLAHAFLSYGQEELIAGNVAGDFIKGSKVLETLPVKMTQGVRLHRFIDTYIDGHLACKRAAIFFKEKYRLYAPAIVDVVMDHFLANDPRHFAHEPALKAFTQQTYQLIEPSLPLLPQSFQTMFGYMQSQDWLYHYRTVKGIEKSLQGLERRAPKMGSTQEAYQSFIGHYYELNQCYFELMDDVEGAVKLELSKNPTE